MEERLIEVTDASIERILNEGLNTNNLDHLQKLTKVRHMAKEDKEMMNNYGNYNGRGPGYNTYGNYGNYGARGYDMRYRGDKAHHYMMESLKDFIKFLYEDAETPQQKQDITQTLQTSIR